MSPVIALCGSAVAGPRWSGNDELFGFFVIRDVCERTNASLKNAATDFPIDASGELTELFADTFDFSDRFGVRGCQAFYTGERRRFYLHSVRSAALDDRR